MDHLKKNLNSLKDAKIFLTDGGLWVFLMAYKTSGNSKRSVWISVGAEKTAWHCLQKIIWTFLQTLCPLWEILTLISPSRIFNCEKVLWQYFLAVFRFRSKEWKIFALVYKIALYSNSWAWTFLGSQTRKHLLNFTIGVISLLKQSTSFGEPWEISFH